MPTQKMHDHVLRNAMHVETVPLKMITLFAAKLGTLPILVVPAIDSLRNKPFVHGLWGFP